MVETEQEILDAAVSVKSLVKLSLAILLILLPVQVSSAADLEPPLKVAWKSSIGIPFTEPYPTSIDLIASDIVFVNYQVLKAIDANDGRLLWGKDWSAGIAYKDGILYAARDFEPALYALNARTGEEIWKKEYPEIAEGIKNSDVLRYNLAIFNDTLYITSKGGVSGYFFVLAVDTQGKLKWHYKQEGEGNMHPAASSNVIVMPYRAFSHQNLIALDLATGRAVWEIKNIDFDGDPYAYKGIFFIQHLRENNSIYVLALSQTGETIWKRKVGNSYGEILAVRENKLFINSENIKVLNPENGDILGEYTSALNPGLLSYGFTNPAAISDNIIYVATTGPSPYIYAIDLNTGKFLWEGGRGGISPYIYNSRFYLIRSGKLYAYEHGFEVKYLYFAMLSIPLIIVNLFLRAKKRGGKFQRNLEFSTLLIIVVYSLMLIVDIPTFTDEMDFVINFSLTDWMLYLLFPAVSIIAGTLAGMRVESKILISIVAGEVPFIISLTASFLRLSDADKGYFFTTAVPVVISLEYIFFIALIYGAIGGIIDYILSRNGKRW